MKELLFVLAFIAALGQTSAAVTRESVRIFHECMRELGIKSFQSEDFHTKFVCINVCENEKAGLVVNGKYLEHKYTESYLSRFPKAGAAEVSILTECVREANKESDKCDVGRALQNCEFKNYNLLFDQYNRVAASNEIKKDN